MGAGAGGPSVAVIVCSRGRPTSLGDTIASILESDHDDFELILVEQSSDAEPSDVVERFSADARLRHIPSETKGLSVARNIGLGSTDAPIVVFTDDDCTVPTDWLRNTAAVLEADETLGCVYGDVFPGDCDEGLGFIPYGVHDEEFRVDRMLQYNARVGIGANVGYRRQAVVDIGGFDELLGAGMRLKAAEELDVALRLVLAGHSVQHSKASAVVHHGFRTYSEGSGLVRGYMYGTGAAFGKLVKCGRLSVVWPFIKMFVGSVGEVTIGALKDRKVPPILGRIEYTFRGIGRAFKTPVDRQTNLFRPGMTTAFSRDA